TTISDPDSPLPRATQRFVSRGHDVHLNVYVGTPAELEERVLDGRLHLAIGHFPIHVPGLLHSALYQEAWGCTAAATTRCSPARPRPSNCLRKWPRAGLSRGATCSNTTCNAWVSARPPPRWPRSRPWQSGSSPAPTWAFCRPISPPRGSPAATCANWRPSACG
ncbi:hypothetical protein C3F00_041870, partial [Pseudomonas sp. MWU13-2860]